jgi:hypothetical protein
MMVALDAAYGQVLLWRRDVELKSDPDMPLRNRMADNWRPLISIADTLGWGGASARRAITCVWLGCGQGTSRWL